MNAKIGVLGGGISGLAAALKLSEKFPGSHITLFEKESSVGGKLSSIEAKSCWLDQGANTLFPQKANTKALLNDLNLWDDLSVTSNITHPHFILLNNKLELIPDSLESKIKSSALSWAAKFKMFRHLFEPELKKDQDIQTFGEKYFGRDFTQVFLDGIVNGVYAGDSGETSVKTLFPQYTSGFKNLFKTIFSSPVNQYGGLNGGMGQLVDALVKKLNKSGVKLVLNCHIKEVNNLDSNKPIEIHGGTDIHEIDLLINTLPLNDLNKLIPNTSRLKKAPSLSFSSLVSVTVKYFKNILDGRQGFGFLVPSQEKKYLLNGFFTSCMYPKRYRGSNSIVQYQLGGVRHPEFIGLSEKEIIEVLKMELSNVPELNNDFTVLDIKKWESALPQFEVEGQKKLRDYKNQLQEKFPKLFILGQEVTGVGIENCLRGVNKCIQDVNKFFSN